MPDPNYSEAFSVLWNDLNEEGGFQKNQPLLAHYTSLETLEQILKNEEIWFSNPLIMNDMEEVRFGILTGRDMVFESQQIEEACKTPERHSQFLDLFSYYFKEFEDNHASDTYVFCLSEHKDTNKDGLLSMWRGYGENGNGAAMVIDTSKIIPMDDSPFIFSKVRYASTEARFAQLKQLLEKFSAILSSTNIPDSSIYVAAHSLFERIKHFALFSKHDGFSEEEEWRVVYFPDRDNSGQISDMLGYSFGKHGAELRLKLKIKPIDGILGLPESIGELIYSIILGPSISSPLTQKAVSRMLEKIGKEKLKEKITPSTIPYRKI